MKWRSADKQPPRSRREPLLPSLATLLVSSEVHRQTEDRLAAVFPAEDRLAADFPEVGRLAVAFPEEEIREEEATPTKEASMEGEVIPAEEVVIPAEEVIIPEEEIFPSHIETATVVVQIQIRRMEIYARIAAIEPAAVPIKWINMRRPKWTENGGMSNMG